MCLHKEKLYIFSITALSFVCSLIMIFTVTIANRNYNKVSPDLHNVSIMAKTTDVSPITDNIDSKTIVMSNMPVNIKTMKVNEKEVGENHKFENMFKETIEERHKIYLEEQEKQKIRDKVSEIESKSCHLGDEGRLFIPDVGVDVALYRTTISNGGYHAQYIVDCSDSAAIFTQGGQDVIADHSHQGFDAMKGSVVGTMAYIKTNNGVQPYICIENTQGHNVGPIVTEDGRYAYEFNDGGIMMYTCNESWHNVTITVWRPYNI